MRILLSNDDGVFAPGIRILAEALLEFGHVDVVAPDGNRSGFSNALTLDKPLRPIRTDEGYWAINGTPADCVHLAINGLLDGDPDMVVSGINSGANLGDDTLYSGTVAAAIEGRFLHKPALAVSLVDAHKFNDYRPAAEIVCRLLRNWSKLNLPQRTVLNINIPGIPLDQIRGMQITRLGCRARSGDVVSVTDPRGREGYWIGVAGIEEDGGVGTDFQAIRDHYVSITPLQMDMTRYDVFDHVAHWVQELK